MTSTEEQQVLSSADSGSVGMEGGATSAAPTTNGGLEAAPVAGPSGGGKKGGSGETYTDAFPPLGGGGGGPEFKPAPAAVKRAPAPVAYNKMAVKSRSTTVSLHIPIEERRFKHLNEFGGEAQQQAKICADIKRFHSVELETSISRDQMLSVIITGLDEKVQKARRDVMNRLQTQANITLNVPKAYHGHVLGKQGKNLQQLELQTATKISLPRQGDSSDVITITGTKEGIARARDAIEKVSSDQSKLAYERIPVEKLYLPFVLGPHGSRVKELTEQTKAKIVPLHERGEISVSGEKEGVMAACVAIRKILDEKKARCQTISVEVAKKQHKYVIGPRGVAIQDVLTQFDVSVEVPPQDDVSNKITLRGEQDKLGPALTMVYSKANSMMSASVKAPSWLRRHIIGKKGEELKKAVGEFTHLHVNFPEDEDRIDLEGPPEEVNPARVTLETMVRELQSKMTYQDVTVPKKFHRNIIGKNGAKRAALMESTGTMIRIPNENDTSEVIRVEGDPDGVIKARQQLLEMKARMENERTKDILIEQRFHRTIIGQSGSHIKEIRQQFNEVQITLPGAAEASEVVVLRGPKDDVEKCYKYLDSMHKDMIAKNFQSTVHIFKEFHKNVIGKSGANIRKIREETNTRIDLPGEASQSDEIVITGKKADVMVAKQRVEDIQKEFANLKEETLTIPHKLHNSMIGAKGRLIRSVMEECGGVLIRFPSEGSTSDKVVVRGPKDDVERACKQLLELSQEREKSSYTEEVQAKPEYHKFLIGKGGSNIRKVKEATGARVVFPSEKDSEGIDIVIIMGEEAAVKKAKALLLEQIKDLENIVEQTCDVDPKWHRHFVARRGEVLNKLAGDYGGVSVSFPRSGLDSPTVTLKGGKECVGGAIQRILEIVTDLESMITKDCVISQRYHRTVMGQRGTNVQRVTRDFNVQIKFPDRPKEVAKEAPKEEEPTEAPTEAPPEAPAAATTQEETTPVVNGGEAAAAAVAGEGEEEEETLPSGPEKCDIIRVTGRVEDVDAAMEALQALVPINVEVDVPFAMHKFIIGQRGQGVRAMMEANDVNISVPPSVDESDKVTVTGTPANVARAREALSERMEEISKDMADRELRKFEVTISVDPKYHSKIIGRRGATITKLREDYGGVNIQLPPSSAPEQDKITVAGYEDKACAAADAILEMIRKLESLTTIEVRIDARVHNRIIGGRGKAIHGIMSEHGVDVKFPRSGDADPNIVVITGEQDACYNCEDHLKDLEDQYLEDVTEKEEMRRYQAPSAHPQRGATSGGAPARGFSVSDAPWDTSSTDDFPTIGGGGSSGGANAGATRWGPTGRR